MRHQTPWPLRIRDLLYLVQLLATSLKKDIVLFVMNLFSPPPIIIAVKQKSYNLLNLVRALLHDQRNGKQASNSRSKHSND